MPPQKPAPNQALINHDVELLKRFEIAQQSGSLDSFSTPELRRIAELRKLIPSHEDSMLQKADKYGVPEIVGSILGGAGGFGTGGPVGIAAGAGAGAGLARYITERVKGSPVEDAVGEAVPATIINAGIPATGSALSGMARGTMRGALPITEAMAEAASGSRLATHRGVDKIVTDMLEGKGITPRGAYDATEKLISEAKLQDTLARAAAQAQGKTIDPTKVAGHAQDIVNKDILNSIHSPGQLSGAEGVIERFLENEGQHTTTRIRPADFSKGDIGGKEQVFHPAKPMTPDRAREVLTKTPFVTGSTEVAGVKEGVRATRRGLSKEYKDVVGPEAEKALSTQAENIPKLELLDQLLTKGGASPTGEVLLTGFRPKFFGIINPTPALRYGGAKVMDRAGKALNPKSAQLLELVSGILADEEQ